MKRTCLFLLAVLALVAMFTAASMSMAEPLQAEREVKAEIARPEDADKNYLTILGDADPSIVEALRASFHNVHFHHYKSDDPILPRYERTVGSFPAVVYQKPNGVVIEKLSGSNFPTSTRELTGFVEQCRPFRPRPDPTPPVQPVAPPVAPVAPVVVPDTVPDTDGDVPLWLYVLLFSGSAAGSAGVQWYKEIKGE